MAAQGCVKILRFIVLLAVSLVHQHPVTAIYIIGEFFIERISREKALISQQGAAAIHFEEHDVIGLLVGDEVGGDGVVNDELIGREGIVGSGLGRDEAERVKDTRTRKVAERAVPINTLDLFTAYARKLPLTGKEGASS